MAEKIKKSMPLLLILVLIVWTIGFGFRFEVPRVEADVTLPSVTVANVSPTVSGVDLTSNPIVLTENTTTTVTCTATLTDTNGGDDISSATATVYRTGVTSACSADNDNCYQIASGDCALSVADDNNKYATCTADIWFHADPTDSGDYSGDTWQCEVTAIDAASATGSNVDANPPELDTLNALIVTGSISYGELEPGTTSSASQTVVATTTGNASIDVYISGTDMATNGYSFLISYQEYATSSVDYGSGTDASSSAVALVLESGKPTTNPSDAADDIYWKIEIPSGQEPATYYGTTTIAAKVKG